MLTQSSATFSTKQDRNKSFRAIKSYKSSKTGRIQCSENSKPEPTLHIAEYEIWNIKYKSSKTRRSQCRENSKLGPTLNIAEQHNLAKFGKFRIRS